MIGPDKKDGSLQEVLARVNKLGVANKLEIKGQVPKNNVPYQLNQRDIFLNTTRYESFGVVVLEAAACGLPIITTMAGEIPYLWKDGVDACLIPIGDAAAMSTAVIRILNEPGLAETLSKNARMKAEFFDWHEIIAHWEVLFGKLVENG